MITMNILSKKINSILFLSALCASFSCLSIAYANPSSSLTEKDKKNIEIESASPSESPLSVKGNVAPLVMLVMGREHNIFSEAYPDYTDIDGNGTIDIMYDPSIKYEGLFESNLCYIYEAGTSNINPYNESQKPLGVWVPSGKATETTKSLTMWNNENRTVYLCSGNNWSGNFLNYVTTSRIDAIKRVLYGGTRLYNTTTPNNSSTPSKYIGNKNKATILKHTHVLRDAHAWGKVLGDDMYEGKMTVHDFTEMPATGENRAYFFVIASEDDQRGSSNYIRYGLVDKAGMPGITNPNAENYIWDWASLQSAWEKGDYAIGSVNVKKKNDANTSLFIRDGYSSELVVTRDILVATCTNEYHPAEHCKAYGDLTNPNYQPYGVLQQYGQGSKPDMNFGLITGSWASNSQYAALRANLGILATEINVEGNDKLAPGDFDFSSSCNGEYCHGLISTLDHFDIRKKTKGTDITYGDCKRTASELPRVGQSGFECSDWGNPLGKLLYGAYAYYKGELQNSTQNESDLGIGSDEYVAPYSKQSTIPYCAQPHALMIADENVSFDSSEYPGGSAGYNNNVGAIEDEVAALSNEANSGFKKGIYFVGKVKGNSLDYYDYLPTLKSINTLADVVGVAPTAAYSFGSYNVAGVASLYSRQKLITAEDKNNSKNIQQHALKTYVVAMKPNMPEIKIHIEGDKYVTILPFAKTPELDYTTSTKDNRIKQNSTNQVADFYVEKLTDTEGIFRINFEDFQYGSDYDMDAVIGYKYEVITGKSGAKYVRVQLSNVDGDGYAAQNAGYVIAGVEHEGAYIDLAKFKTNQYDNQRLDIDNIVNDFALTGNCNPTSYYDALKRWGGGCSSYDRYKGVTINEKTYQDELGITRDSDGKLSSNIIDDYYAKITNKNSIWGNLYYRSRFEIIDFLNSINENTTTIDEAKKLLIVGYRRRTYDYVNEYNYKSDADKQQVTSRIFKVSSEASNVWLKSPLWYAAKFGLDKERGTEGEPSNYFLASNPAMLRTGINEMLKKISTRTHSGSSFATEKKATSADDYAYATLYDPTTWWGDVRNANIDTAKGTNEGGYDYDSFNNGWSLKDAMENIGKRSEDDNIDNRKAPKRRAIVTFDKNEGELVRLFASENSAKNKTSAEADDRNSAYKNLGQNIANLIMGGTYDNTNLDHKLYLNRLVRWLAGEHQYEYKGTPPAPDTLELILIANGGSPGEPLRVRSTDPNSNDMNLRYTLGDIINSDVRVFTDKPQGQSGGNKLLVVGANDGMLHFAKIEDEGKNGIKLLLSYVPTPALPKLKELARQTYGDSQHYSFVDSTPQVYKDESNVVLYGTYGLGLRGAYAFNVADLGSKLKTDGNDLSTSNDIITPLTNMGFLRWELTDDVLYAGKMREAPVLAYSKGEDTEEHPYLIFSSGYDADKSGIFVVDMLASNNSSCLTEDIYKGDVPKKSPCIVSAMPLGKRISQANDDLSNQDPWGMERKNVPTRVTLLDLDSNHNYQAIYWADNFGLVWKAPLDHKDIIKNPKCWGGFGNCLATTVNDGSTDTTNDDDYKPRIIFRAVDSNNVAQPITTRPAVGYHKNSGIGIVIGTGSYWVYADSTDTSLRYNSSQSVYMIRDLSNSYDEDGKSVNASESDVRRCIGNSGSSKCLKELKVTVAEDNGEKFRKFEPNNNHAGNVNYGWYFDLNPIDENGNTIEGSGERIYINPVISGDTLTIASNVPNVNDSCNGGGKSYVIQGSLMGGEFNQKAEFNALAKNLVVNVYTDADGNIKTIIQVPLDDENSSLAGVKTVPLETSEPTVRSSSWLRLY